jgi:L-malate glycosyltransferase
MLNNYSGSPHILALIIKGLAKKGYKIELYTSKHQGFLSDINNVKTHKIYYNFWDNHKIITFLVFLFAQLRYFLAVIKYFRKKNTIIYINTILPFGAALGAALIRKKVIYHVHENPVKRNPVNSIALKVFYKFAYKAIFVSKYLYESYNIAVNKKRLVYNALSPEFVNQAKNHIHNSSKAYNILMICSLRIFKGVLIFTELASKLPEYNFTLILNANPNEIEIFFKNFDLPKNLIIHPTKTDLNPFYSIANLVVNLSLPDLWIETFGLTALEAMAYGIPVIVPPVGGISEIIDDAVQGYKVDSRNINELIDKIRLIFNNESEYLIMTAEAKLKANNFTYSKMLDGIENVINE